VAAYDDLEEQMGLLAAHRQIADLIEDQQPAGVDRAMHDLAVVAWRRLNAGDKIIDDGPCGSLDFRLDDSSNLARWRMM
jgi:hypothetical protein